MTVRSRGVSRLPSRARLAVTTLAVALVVAGCGAESDTSDPPGSGAFKSPISEPISVGSATNETQPSSMTLVGGKLVVLPASPGSLLLVDPTAGKLADEPPWITREYDANLVSDGTRLWAIRQSANQYEFGPTVERIDLAPSEYHPPFEIEQPTGQLAVYAGSRFWTANEDSTSILRHTADGDPDETVKPGGFVAALGAGDGKVYVAVDDERVNDGQTSLRAYDAKSAEPVSDTVAMPSPVTGVTSGGGRVWVTLRREPPPGATARYESVVVRLDPTSLKPQGKAIPVSGFATNPIWAGDALWILDGAEQTVRRVDPNAPGTASITPTPEQQEADDKRERARKAEEENAKRVREAMRIKPSRAAGCTRLKGEDDPRFAWAPPPPEISAERVGDTVEVSYSFDSLDQKPICRPWRLAIYAYAKGDPSSDYTDAQVSGTSGRVTLPPQPEPVLEVRVAAKSLVGIQSEAARTKVR